MILEHYRERDGRSVYRLSLATSDLVLAELSERDRALLLLAEAGTVSMKLAGLALIAQRVEEGRERATLAFSDDLV